MKRKIAELLARHSQGLGKPPRRSMLSYLWDRAAGRRGVPAFWARIWGLDKPR